MHQSGEEHRLARTGQTGDPEPDGRIEHVLAEFDQRAGRQPGVRQDVSEGIGHVIFCPITSHHEI
jgi:hypothetical protein